MQQYAGPMSAGAGNLAGAQQLKEASLTGAIEEFDLCIKRAADCAGRLEMLVGRIFGPGPTGVAGEAEQAPPPSLIAAVNIRRNHLASQLDRIERCINGIERVL